MDVSFRAFVENSSLPKEDKDFWINILVTLTEDQIKIFEDFIEGREENLKLLTKNLKDKETAFRNNNQEALDKILKEEEANA